MTSAREESDDHAFDVSRLHSNAALRLEIRPIARIFICCNSLMDDSAILSETLSKLTDKNLDGRVEYDKSRPVAFGGQGCVYMGQLRPSGDLVAVKEVRVTAKQMIGMRKMDKVRASSLLKKSCI